MSAAWFRTASTLVDQCEIRIDRPKGSRHPRVPEYIYPVDYGYLVGTDGGDGEGIDVFVGTCPGRGVVGFLATVDPYSKNAEVKLLLNVTNDEVDEVLSFYGDQPQQVVFVANAETV